MKHMYDWNTYDMNSSSEVFLSLLQEECAFDNVQLEKDTSGLAKAREITNSLGLIGSLAHSLGL